MSSSPAFLYSGGVDRGLDDDAVARLWMDASIFWHQCSDGGVNPAHRSAPRRADAPRTNRESLVALAVSEQVASALVRGGAASAATACASFGHRGTLNKRVGDRAVGLAADHVEPGVSVRNNDRESRRQPCVPQPRPVATRASASVATVVSGPQPARRGP